MGALRDPARKDPARRSRIVKRVLFAAGVVIGAVVLVALALVLFVDVNRYKPRLEVAASDALGMDVRFGGRLGIGFVPGLHVTAEDARVLDGQGVVVASARSVNFHIGLLPLLRREVRLRRLELTQPRLSIERDTRGTLNIERLKRAVALLGALDGATASLSDGILRYADRRSGEVLEADAIELVVSRIRFAKGETPPLKVGSLEAEFGCGAIRTKRFSMAAVKISIDGENGVFALEPVTMRMFGGQAAATIRADLSGPIPLCQIRYSLPRFRVEEFLETLYRSRSAEGAMDFTASLSMQGRTVGQMVQTAAGEMSLRGENLLLTGNDLDRVLSRLEASQNLNVVDVGAVFFAGPLGLAVTKGRDFAGLLRGSGGSSRIRTVVSEWRVEGGVARATDVAMATRANRVALQGGLDFVHGRFAAVTVAVVDARGCARLRQTIRGPFETPEVEKPRVLTSIAGPMLNLYRRTRRLFPSAPCEVFYSGSVAAPVEGSAFVPSPRIGGTPVPVPQERRI